VFKSRWFAVAVLVAFGLSVAVWATRSWTDSKPLVKPAGVAQAQPDIVKFQCGAPWGTAKTEGPKTTVRPVVGTPCGDRAARRNVAIADVALAGIGLAVLSTRRRTHDEDTQTLVATAPAA
jgi:hypothetical protein